MNLKVLHDVVGPWPKGAVVPPAAIQGGQPEAARLIALGAMTWTTAEPTVEPPAALSAVMEMGDDELLAENRRLREQLAARRADEAAAVRSAAAQFDALKVEHDALGATHAAALADLSAAQDRHAAEQLAHEQTRAELATALAGGAADVPPAVEGGEAVVTEAVPEQAASSPPAAVRTVRRGGR